MARKQAYKILTSYEAPDLIRSKQASRAVTSLFKEGETVLGTPYEGNSILVDDRYVIPDEYVEHTSEFKYIKRDSRFDETVSRIKEQAVKMSEKDKERLDEVGTNVSDVIEGRTKAKLNEQTKAYRNGAILGLGSGVLLALYLRKNIWVFGIVGVAIGGYISNEIRKAKKGNNKVEPINSNDGE